MQWPESLIPTRLSRPEGDGERSRRIYLGCAQGQLPWHSVAVAPIKDSASRSGQSETPPNGARRTSANGPLLAAARMTLRMPEAEVRRQLLESVQRYGREFRRKNLEVKQEVEAVCASLRAAERIDAELVRRLQILQLLIYGCYTKQPVIVASSLQICHLLAAQDLLVEYDRQLLAQLLTEMADSGLQLPEIGATALACALTPGRLSGAYLGKAVGVCLREKCCIADLHRLAALVLDRVSHCQIADSVPKTPPSPSLASPTRKAPPKDPATADAFALLRDLYELSQPGRSEPAAWLHGVSEVSPLAAFDVTAYAVHNRAAMLLDGGEVEKLLNDKIFPAVCAGLDAAERCDDELFLRLCVLAHLLLRNYGVVPRCLPPCAEVLRQLLHCLPQLPPNRRCMVLRAWASLLTRVQGPTVSLYFPAQLPAVVEWLCTTLRAACEDPEEPSAALEAPHGTYVAFRGAGEVTLKEAQLAIDLEWFSTKQRTSFSAPEDRFLLLAALRALLVSLNSVLAQPEAASAQDLSELLAVTCKASTTALTALVWRCVHRTTEQAMTLSLETLFELSGRSGHEETCRAILALHRSVADDCRLRLKSGGPPELAERLAQFALSGVRLASEFAPFVPPGALGWTAFCELFAGAAEHFRFPLFCAAFESVAGAPPPDVGPSAEDEEAADQGEFRLELLSETEAFAATTARFPLEVLGRLLTAEFEFGQAAEKGDIVRFRFVMAKVTELAVFNLQRFHAFAAQWLSGYVLLFFIESPHDLPAARHCFALLFDRLMYSLELAPAGATEEAIVAALHLLESCSERELMALQITCLHRLLQVLNTRTVTGVGGDFKTLVALPDLLRRHSQLPHASNVRSAASVFSAFALSPALEAAPSALLRQACKRGLRLGLELMRQEVDLKVAADGPTAMRHLLSLVDAELRRESGDCEDLGAFLLQHLPELEKFCRDERPMVATEASVLLFDVLGGAALTLSDSLFSVMASKMLLPGLKAFISSFENNPDNAQVLEKIEAFANYILNAASCILRRYSNNTYRPHVPVDLWRDFFLCLRDAAHLAIEPITFAVLSAFSCVSSGLARIEGDENMTAIQTALWSQGMGLAQEAAQPEWHIATEVLLPDVVLLLCDLFAVQFPALNGDQRKECVNLTVRMIRHRSQVGPAGSSAVAKERSLMSLVERTSRGFFEGGGEDGKQLASDLIAAVCDVFFEEAMMMESDGEQTWPQPYHVPYMRLAYSLMSDFTTKVVSKGGAKECSEWLQQHMRLCEKASRHQYRCSDLYTWRCVHNCVAIAVDSLTTAVEVCGSHEDLADSYEHFLSCHLFSAEKHSRFLSSADFLEHQTMEREILASMRDFVSTPNGSPDAKNDSVLHTRLSRYLVTQLGSKAHVPVTDAVVNTQTAGPSADDEFFDSRHWRFQIACVEALEAIVDSLKNMPRQDGYACCQVFDAYISYAKEALSSFHDRLEVRGNEPLPAVCYYEVNAIIASMKNMLTGGHMSSVFIPGIVELYPYFVDLVTILYGQLLNDLLEVLHAYKAFMSTSNQSSIISKSPRKLVSNIFSVLR